jgi:hypothetical protein
VRRLPEGLFVGCFSLSRIEVSNIEEIGAFAFAGTRSLRTFDFSSLAPSAPIGNGAFFRSGLKSVVLSGDSARFCGGHVFSDCKSQREAVVNLTALSDCLFRGCSTLERVWMTARVSQISNAAFQNCSALRSIDLSSLSPEAEIVDSAFAESGLVEVEVEFPAKLQSIGDKAFQGCAWLASVRLPRELGSIGMEMFNDCRSLRRLGLGDVGTWPKDAAEMIDGSGKLNRLELIGRNLKSIPAAAIEMWLADNAVVVSAVFKGRRLGRFEIVPQ